VLFGLLAESLHVVPHAEVVVAMTNGSLTAEAEPLVIRRVYPTSTLLIDRSPKTAVPEAPLVTESVPERAPPPGFESIAAAACAPKTPNPSASASSTRTPGGTIAASIAEPTRVSFGCCEKLTDATAASGVTTEMRGSAPVFVKVEEPVKLFVSFARLATV
jgi:hypothetical protein